MPLPMTGSMCSGSAAAGMPAFSAASRMGRASGCSEPASARAAQASAWFFSTPGASATTSVSCGRPLVSVPVLSTATTSILAAVSRNSPP